MSKNRNEFDNELWIDFRVTMNEWTWLNMNYHESDWIFLNWVNWGKSRMFYFWIYPMWNNQGNRLWKFGFFFDLHLENQADNAIMGRVHRTPNRPNSMFERTARTPNNQNLENFRTGRTPTVRSFVNPDHGINFDLQGITLWATWLMWTSSPQ